MTWTFEYQSWEGGPWTRSGRVGTLEQAVHRMGEWMEVCAENGDIVICRLVRLT